MNLGSHRLNRYKDGNYSYNVDGNDALGYHDKSTNVYYITNSNGKGFFYDGDNTVYNKLQSYADLVINKDYTFCYEVYNKLKSYVEDKDSWSYDVLEVMMSDIGDTVGYNSFAKKELDGKSYEEQIFITMDKVKDKYYFTDVIIRDKLEVDGEPKYSAIEMHIDIVHENEELDNIVFSKPNAEVAKGNVDLDDIDFGLIDSLK